MSEPSVKMMVARGIIWFFVMVTLIVFNYVLFRDLGWGALWVHAIFAASGIFTWALCAGDGGGE